MTTDDIEVLEKFDEAGLSGDMETVIELTHPDCVISEPHALPYGGTYEGKEAFVDLISDVSETYNQMDVQVKDRTQAGNRVVVEYLFKAVPSEGEDQIQMPMIELYRVEEEKVIGTDVYYKDTAALVEALE
jgi:ketosteroid isomerase-like protein